MILNKQKICNIKQKSCNTILNNNKKECITNSDKIKQIN